jgi:hypothetical protein
LHSNAAALKSGHSSGSLHGALYATRVNPPILPNCRDVPDLAWPPTISAVETSSGMPLAALARNDTDQLFGSKMPPIADQI